MLNGTKCKCGGNYKNIEYDFNIQKNEKCLFMENYCQKLLEIHLLYQMSTVNHWLDFFLLFYSKDVVTSSSFFVFG